MNDIPVYINNRDRLSTTRGMVEYLHGVPRALPIIIDNDSTYPPLLDYYKTCDCEIVLLGVNAGPRAAWHYNCIDHRADYYAVSDSDLDLHSVPTDVFEVLISGFRKYQSVIKVGLSLEIDDLQDSHPTQKHWAEAEAKYWTDRADKQFWNAAVDTTFALYKGGYGFRGYAPALRADRPYAARHVPFYRTPAEWDDEERYYAEHCNPAWATVVRIVS